MATADEIHLRDEDRLPWLETVEPDEHEEGPGLGRVLALVVLGLAILAAIVWAVLHFSHPAAPPAAVAAEAGVIPAPDGDYKIKPDEPGGLKVTGEGDTAVATSTGNSSAGAAIDTKQVPEAPVAGQHDKGHAAPVQGGTTATQPLPASGGKLAATPPVAAPRAGVPGAASHGSLVQLGAFPSEATANAAWGAMAKRFGYVATLGKSVEQADVNGRKVFRLRVNAGSANAAADICGRLKVAGEKCFVVSA